MKDWTYDAFISYRHAELDKFVAEKLHRQLESFRLPKRVLDRAAHKGPDGQDAEVRTRINRVFRDKDELPLTNNLEDPIRKALEESEYLIVICSPRLKESLWCKKEIDTFISLHGREKILAVLVEGEPEESFPEQLLFWEETVTRPDGSTETVRHPLEPLAADVRGKDRRAVQKAMKTEVLRLLAPMFGLRYDDLRQRHRERRMKRILSASLAAAGVCLAFGAVSTAMALRINSQKEQIASQNEELQNRQEQIQAQNELLMHNQALNLAEDAFDTLEKGDRMGAIRLATEALTEYDGMEMPHTARAQYALTESLHVYDNGSNIKALYQFETKGIISFMKTSPDGNRLLTCDAAEGLLLWDVNTGTLLAKLPDSGNSSEENCSFLGNDRVAYTDSGLQIQIYDIASGEGQTLGELSDVFALYADSEREYLVVETMAELLVYDGQTLEQLCSWQAPGGLVYIRDIFFPVEDEAVLAMVYELEKSKKICFWDVKKDVLYAELDLGDCIFSQVRCRGDRAYLLFNRHTDSLSTDVCLWACNWKTGEIDWEKTFAHSFGTYLYCPYAEGAENLLVDTGYEIRLLCMDDGSETAHSALGSSVVGGGVFLQSDLFIVFTRSGEYHIINGESAMDYSREGLFDCHSQNVKAFNTSAAGFLVLPYQDNRVTLYNYHNNEDATEITGDVPEREAAFLEYGDAVNFAQEEQLEKAALTRYVFEAADQGLTFLYYSDATLEIYRTEDMELLASLSDITDSVRFYYGEDKDGNLYVGSGEYGYILNEQYEIQGRIEGLRFLNAEEDCLVLESISGTLKQVPIYNLEELLVKAQECMIEFTE